MRKAEHSPPTACKRVVSGTISLPSQGFFSPFPHGTGSLSVASEYLVLPDGPGGFKQGFSCPALLRSHWKEDCIFTYAAVTLSGRPFQTVQLMLSCPSFYQEIPETVAGFCPLLILWSCNPKLSFRIAWFRLLRFRSPLLSESRLFSLPSGTEMVHFPEFARSPYEFRRTRPAFTPVGFPHSEISGSQPISGSPKLIAADHVLLRLLAPRHPHTRS